MALTINHPFVSAKSDGTDSTEVQPSDWNDDHDATMVADRILGRVTASTGPVEELTAAQVITLLDTVAGTFFPSGTLMLFQQTAAPTGWTKQTTHNDKALRVVSGTASSGGTTAFTTVFGSRTITQANLPNYNLALGSLSVDISDPGHTHTLTRTKNKNNTRAGGGGTCNDGTESGVTDSSTTGITASLSGTLPSGGSDTAMDFAVQYVDLIIASKD